MGLGLGAIVGWVEVERSAVMPNSFQHGKDWESNVGNTDKFDALKFYLSDE
jgi:hypothetical protein